MTPRRRILGSGSGFNAGSEAIRTVVQDDEIVPDDVPVADAVEQQRLATGPVPDEAVESPGDRPLEASAADWLEQRETVDLDAEEGR